MPSSTNMTIRLDAKDKKILEQLALSTNRSKSYLAAEAIRDFIQVNQWQIKETELALIEADSGEFATTEEVGQVFNQWR